MKDVVVPNQCWDGPQVNEPIAGLAVVVRFFRGQKLVTLDICFGFTDKKKERESDLPVVAMAADRHSFYSPSSLYQAVGDLPHTMSSNRLKS